MQTLTTINDMLAGNQITVPDYQRSYSWDTETDYTKPDKQVNQFLTDLEDYRNSAASAPYYFGHFLFEKYEEKKFGIIDGQQRLTTIVIFLSSLFRRLQQIRQLTTDELETYEDMVKRNLTYRFTTVDYDKLLFRDYVIDGLIGNKSTLETTSAKRIVDAFDYFTRELKGKEEHFLLQLLNIVKNASCTTHPVSNEVEAIQMFIFQNNRGKKPSDLEIIKAQFMFQVHLKGGESTDDLIAELKERFESIYKSIAKIEYRIREDDILIYTLRVHFNSLWEAGAIERIGKLLEETNALQFIQEFTRSLAECFKNLTTFFITDEKKAWKFIP